MKPACWEACFLYPSPTVEHSNNCLLLLCRLFLEPSGHYTKITQKSQSEFYTIADATGVSTGQVTDGYHNVSKMSNGQFRYSAHFTCYPSAIPNGNIVGYLPESANPYQIVYEYTYDITNQKWVRIRIGNNDRSIQLMNLDGTNVTSQRVELEYHIDF